MKKSNLKLKINEITGDYEVIHNGFSWVSSGRRPYIIIKKRRAVCFNILPALFCFKKAFYIYSRLDCYNAFGLYGFRKTVRFQNHINRKNRRQ